jgi:hypothetical protein
MAIKKHDLDNWTPSDPSNPLKSLAHEVNLNLDSIQASIDKLTPGVGMLPGFKSARVDDGVEVTLDTIVVKLNTGSPRSLQFKLTTGTMNVHISGVIYWSNNGNANWGAGHWQSKTLTTSWQQPFGWDFPWANDNAVYNLQDMTNGRFYRITLSIGNGYKGNFIVMERLV